MPEKKENRPLRVIRTATPRTNTVNTVWGLTLDCGHYVERADVSPSETHPRARCDDCARGAKPICPATVICGVCVATGDGYGVPGCKACYGFGRVEKVIQVPELLHGPKPGMAPGDHVLGFWIANLNGALLTTTIAKRGRHYIGETMRASVGPSPICEATLKKGLTKVEQAGGGVTVIRDRFFPTGSFSQDFLLQDVNSKLVEVFDAELQHAGMEGVFKRVFAELRTTDVNRALALEEALTTQLMGPE